MLGYPTKHAAQQRPGLELLGFFFCRNIECYPKEIANREKPKHEPMYTAEDLLHQAVTQQTLPVLVRCLLDLVSIFGRSASRISPVGSYPLLLARAKHSSCIMKWTYFARRSSSIAHLYLGVWPPDTESLVWNICPNFISTVFVFTV